MYAGFRPKRALNSCARLSHLVLRWMRKHVSRLQSSFISPQNPRMVEGGAQVLVQFVEVSEDWDRELGSHLLECARERLRVIDALK